MTAKIVSDKKVVVKVAVKPAPAKKPEPVKAKAVVAKSVVAKKSVLVPVVMVKPIAFKTVEAKPVVAKAKAKPPAPVQNKLINRLLNKPKVKEPAGKTISKFLTDKIPKKMVKIARPDNAALLSLMQKNISSTLS